MIPTHNSTLGLDIARSAAIKHQMTTCVFSLEMSRNEITMRLLSAEARVSLHHMRTGKLTDDDWTRLARRMGEVSNAPLFIDDSPNMSMMEIRAKCRRLKQRHDLKLVVVDYLQLMTSGKRVESRQQEVSEFSRALKLLAKELEVPVIAISQLNRWSEQRTDKKPQMSDLRESGCLPASTRILRADTGAEVTLGELMATGATRRPRVVARRVAALPPAHHDLGVLQRAQGGLHPHARVRQDRAGDGQPPVPHLRRVVPAGPSSRPGHAWRFLATCPRRSNRQTTGATATSPRSRSSDHLPTTSSGCPSGSSPCSSGTCGATAASSTPTARVTVSSRLRPGSRRTAEVVSRLLLRFGISSVLRPDSLEIGDTDDQRRFLQEIGFPGPEAARMLRRVLAETQSRSAQVTRDDEVWARVERLFDHDPARVRAAAASTLRRRDPTAHVAA